MTNLYIPTYYWSIADQWQEYLRGNREMMWGVFQDGLHLGSQWSKSTFSSQNAPGK